jgi:small subunit ribosomal protein S13
MFLDSRKIELNQSIKSAFRHVKGVGVTRLNVLLRRANVNRNTHLESLEETFQSGLSNFITNHYTTGGNLNRFELSFLKPHTLYGSYKGIRMSQGLPSNGQRTHSNASTASKIRRVAATVAKPVSVKKRKINGR